MNEEWIKKEMVVFQDMCGTYFKRHYRGETPQDGVKVLQIVGNLSVWVHDALHRATELSKAGEAYRRGYQQGLKEGEADK